MKTYHSVPESEKYNNVGKVYVSDGGRPRLLSPRRDLCDHSPTGFAWGYHGSGPAQLALAILADASGDDALAVRHHQSFKSQVIALLAGRWDLAQSFVLDWLKQQEKRHDS